MSMQAWDIPNSNDNGNSFGNTIDPSMAFAGGTPTSANFDFSSMHNPQLQRLQQNGTAMRNGTASPAGFNPSMYQPASVVPAKRQHEFTGSPRQASRSQTPQQGPYPGYAGVNGQTLNTYHHLQHANATNASPSPIMQNQPYNPQAVPPRMSTASPSPYSPAGPNFGPQASPVQSDYGMRGDTPSNLNPNFMPVSNGMTPNVQNYSPQPGNMMAGYGANGMPGYPTPGMTPEQQQRAQMMRQMQTQQNMVAAQRQAQAVQAQAHAQAQAQAQAQAAQAQAQAQAQAHIQAQSQMGGMQPGMNNPNQMANMQQRAIREQIARHQASRLDQVIKQPESFANTLAVFMQQRGVQFQRFAVINGRHINCALIFNIVMKNGGSRRLSAGNGWLNIAVALGVSPQYAAEVQSYYQQNIAPYESTWQQAMQAQGQKIAQQQQQQQQAQAQAQAQAQQQQQQQVQQQQQQQQQSQVGQADSANMPMQMQPNRNIHYNHGEQSAGAAMIMRKPPTVSDAHTPVKGPPQPQQVNGMSATPPNSNSLGPPAQSNSLAQTPKRPSVEPKQEPDTVTGSTKLPWNAPLSEQIGDTFVAVSRKAPGPTAELPNEELQEHHGGFMLSSSIMNSLIFNMTRARPDHPRVTDLGTIDMHALLMGLKSGLPGETRLALETLQSIVWEPTAVLGPFGPKSEQAPGHAHRIHLDFKECGDLVESLIDCAENQLELLADNAEADEFAESTSLRPVEEIATECMLEMNSLQEIPEHGSMDYELEQAAEKLLCITTILRNLTDTSIANRMAIADACVVKFMANVFRHLGTRHMLLRTFRNTFDFFKDAVIYLSAVASDITLSSKDEASWILQFLICFAGPIQQVNSEDSELYFPPYMRGSQRYLPFAIQVLAKLLASGDPNRSLLKSVFAADLAAGSSPCLLTRAFSMCISPVPSLGDDNYLKIRARATFLTQGLLAADSLVSFIPQTEHSLARAWLSSEDGMAERLLRTVARLTIDFQPPRVTTAQGPLDDGHDMVQEYGLSILRKLAERAKDAEVSVGKLSASLVLKRAILSSAMMAGPMHERTLQPLVNYLSMDV